MRRPNAIGLTYHDVGIWNRDILCIGMRKRCRWPEGRFLVRIEGGSVLDWSTGLDDLPRDARMANWTLALTGKI